MHGRAVQEERGCTCKHSLAVHPPPPSSGTQGMGSSPLFTWQTGGRNRRGHVQSRGGTATREGVSAEGTIGGEVSMYLSAPLMQTVGRVPVCSFACYSLV